MRWRGASEIRSFQFQEKREREKREGMRRREKENPILPVSRGRIAAKADPLTHGSVSVGGLTKVGRRRRRGQLCFSSSSSSSSSWEPPLFSKNLPCSLLCFSSSSSSSSSWPNIRDGNLIIYTSLESYLPNPLPSGNLDPSDGRLLDHRVTNPVPFPSPPFYVVFPSLPESSFPSPLPFASRTPVVAGSSSEKSLALRLRSLLREGEAGSVEASLDLGSVGEEWEGLGGR